jgi:hypothetical protein
MGNKNDITIVISKKDFILWPSKMPGQVYFLLLHALGVHCIIMSVLVLIPPVCKLFYHWDALQTAYVFTVFTFIQSLSFFLSTEVVKKGIHGKTVMALSLMFLLSASILSIVGLFRSDIILMISVALFGIGLGTHLAVIRPILVLFVSESQVRCSYVLYK